MKDELLIWVDHDMESELADIEQYLQLIEQQLAIQKSSHQLLLKKRASYSLPLVERIRKISDYKSKFSEEAQNECPSDFIDSVFDSLKLPTPNSFPYQPIATFSETPSSTSTKAGFVSGIIQFRRDLIQGLDHLDGYEKAWLNCVIVPSETTSIQPLLEHLPPDSPSSSFCVSIADSPLQALILGDIVSVNVKKGTVVYQLPVDDAAILLHPSCCIVDLKIYIPYVEARQLENRAPPHP